MTGPVIQLDQFTSLLTEVEAEPVRPRLPLDQPPLQSHLATPAGPDGKVLKDCPPARHHPT
jgi:hypothetical protein